MMDGFISLLKPPGMTSSDAVLMVRRMLPRGVRVGHGGTLDPDAAGVLPICVGRATRLFDYIIDKEKTYIAELTLGVTTDTQDATGHVLERKPVEVGEAEVRAALCRLTGSIQQIPPMYSAIKRGGRPLYEMARKGQAVAVEARTVIVRSLDYLYRADYNRHMIRVVCRKGVYVRTLMHDLGQILGCGGHMSFLLRSRAGFFDTNSSQTIEELAALPRVQDCMVALDAPLAHYPRADYDEKWLTAVRNGNPLHDAQGFAPEEIVRVYVGDRFAGMASADSAGLLRFRAMLLDTAAPSNTSV